MGAAGYVLAVRKPLFSLLVTAAAIAAAASACSSTDRDGVPQSNANAQAEAGAPTFGDDVAPKDETYTPDQIWANDPPPKWCGPAGKPAPAPPGGTPDCPDDKNKEGCPCKTLGEKASCWPGKRVNRDLGQCKDGTTTCETKGELGKVWGKCQGFELPTPGATKGAQACKCFSQGQWKIDNLVPCFVQGGTGSYATSATCAGGTPPPNTTPSSPWSKNTLTVDCAGHLKLCYTIKAGDAKNPSPSDCSLGTVCTEGDYLKENTPQAFPELPGWVSNNSACVDKIMAGSAVYGEMTVIGKSVLCDEIGDGTNPLVFNRVQYCPMTCAKNPSDPACAQCGASGAGQF